MRRLMLIFSLMVILSQSVSALAIEAPTAPQSAQAYMKEESEDFGSDLWYIFKQALSAINTSIHEATRTCLSLTAVVLLVSLAEHITEKARLSVDLVGAISMGILFLKPVNTLIDLGVETVTQITEYGKLLLPVMTAALAAQGGVTASGALYTGTAFFSALLSSLITNVAVPLIYIFICLAIAQCAIGDKTLKSLHDLVKWALTWILKTVLYVFTGYMTITGVISGTADASAIKATKLTISGAVPVVGSILSDASEAILVSAGVMKSAAGVYGILTVIALCIGPFLRIGVQYLMLKLTSAVCNVIGTKRTSVLLENFSASMGLILAMTGTVCMLQLISTVCFMKGVS